MSNYKIVPDPWPENPLTAWDNLGTMYCQHRRYILGDKDAVAPEKCDISLPIYMYDHSGVGLSTDNSQYPFNCPWDSGQVGVIYVTKAKIRKEFGVKRITKRILSKVLEILKGEVETYSCYLNGEVYGYIIYDENGEEIDSCYGFYDYDEAEREAQKYMQ